jgi:uncharacterized protein (TIGR03663 family)
MTSEAEVTTNRKAELISACAYLLAVIAALVLRFYLLELKPLHHDEGVNSYFLLNLARSGKYAYDPANYHGPTLYYFSWLALKIFGESEFALRVYPAICGVLTVALMWGLRRGLGLVGTPIAAWALALSPGLVYYSRDFIHESSFVFFTVGMIVSLYQWIISPGSNTLTTYYYKEKSREVETDARDTYLVAFTIFSALLFATKETALHTYLVLFLALICAAIWTALRNKLVGKGELESSPYRVLRSFKYLTTLGLFLVFIFCSINVLFYSSFFTNWKGVLDVFKSIFMWTGRGVNEGIHDHVFTYYLGILIKLELPLVIAAVIGIVLTLWRGTRFGLFTMAWACGMFLGYSIIPYKTPWLMVSMLVALAVFSGYVAQELHSVLRFTALRIVLIALLIAVAVPMARISWQVNRHKYEDNENTTGYFTEWGKRRKLTPYTDTQYGYVYAQTNKDLLNLVQEVRRVKPRTIHYATPNYWPLPWYFRNEHIDGYTEEVPDNFAGGAIITSEEQRAEAEKKLLDNYRAQEFVLRPGVHLLLFVREPEKR